jgi:glycosyltransferase involved in cell wall biosynthesis
LGRLWGKVCNPVELILPNNTKKYISTYYPIPEWVHANAISAVLLVHDLIPLHHPEWFPTKLNEHLLQKVIHSVNNEDSVVCVSEATKRDFQYYNSKFPVERISVAYEAAAEVFTPKVLSEKLKNKLAIDKNHYFLSVCTLEKRKNLQVVVQAYRLLLEQNSDVPKLVLTGAKGWKTGDLYEQIKDINSRFGTKVVLSGYVNDEELAELYSNCVAFVYPSLYEGFGLPPLEAMQCGAPVITSNVSSLPEVVADAGILINPNDAQELAKAMWQISSHDSEQHRIRSMSRAKEFSWEKMANVIMRTI